MVKSLLEYETVDAEEVRAILENKPYDRSSGGGTAVVTPVETDKPAEEAPREKPSLLPPNIRPEPA